MKPLSIKKNLFLLGILFFHFGIAQQISDSVSVFQLQQTNLKNQATDSVFNFVISSVKIVGNKKTHSKIILRELPFKIGESLPLSVKEINELLQNTQQLIYNTNLFSTVSIALASNDTTQIVLLITVTERLYFYPVPQFRLIDRNFNDWWKTFERDPERTIYGVRIFHNNVSGHADRLSVAVMNGYFRSVSLGYSMPYINKSLTKGFSASAVYTENLEFAFATSNNNKLLLYRTPDFQRKNFTVSAGLSIRKGLYSKQFFQLHYSAIHLPDSFAFKNIGFINSKANQIDFTDVNYTYQYIKVDNINYPQKGKVFSATLFNRGLGFKKNVSMTSVDFIFRNYLQHKKFNFAFQLYTKCKLPFKQPYLNQRMLGYGDLYLRGLEYYVVDGVAGGLAKSTISRKVVKTDLPLPFKIRDIKRIPLSVFLKTYADLGYIHRAVNYDSKLNNKMLYSGGLGLDLLSLYDMQLGIEYSINQLGEAGLFFHTRAFF